MLSSSNVERQCHVQGSNEGRSTTHRYQDRLRALEAEDRYSDAAAHNAQLDAQRTTRIAQLRSLWTPVERLVSSKQQTVRDGMFFQSLRSTTASGAASQWTSFETTAAAAADVARESPQSRGGEESSRSLFFECEVRSAASSKSMSRPSSACSVGSMRAVVGDALTRSTFVHSHHRLAHGGCGGGGGIQGPIGTEERSPRSVSALAVVLRPVSACTAAPLAPVPSVLRPASAMLQTTKLRLDALLQEEGASILEKRQLAQQKREDHEPGAVSEVQDDELGIDPLLVDLSSFTPPTSRCSASILSKPPTVPVRPLSPPTPSTSSLVLPPLMTCVIRPPSALRERSNHQQEDPRESETFDDVVAHARPNSSSEEQSQNQKMEVEGLPCHGVNTVHIHAAADNTTDKVHSDTQRFERESAASFASRFRKKLEELERGESTSSASMSRQSQSASRSPREDVAAAAAASPDVIPTSCLSPDHSHQQDPDLPPPTTTTTTFSKQRGELMSNSNDVEEEAEVGGVVTNEIEHFLGEHFFSLSQLQEELRHVHAQIAVSEAIGNVQ